MPFNFDVALDWAYYRLRYRSVQPMFYKYDEADQKVLDISFARTYRSHDPTYSLTKILRRYLSNIKEDPASHVTTLYDAAFRNDAQRLYELLLDIAWFRTVKKQWFGFNKPLHFEEKNPGYTLKAGIELRNHQRVDDLTFQKFFYDVQCKVEAIIGFKLTYDKDHQCLYPEFFMVKVLHCPAPPHTRRGAGPISEQNLRPDKPPVVKYTYLNITRIAEGMAVAYNGKYWTSGSLIQLLDENKLEHPTPWIFNQDYKYCRICGGTYMTKVKFEFCKHIEEHCCPSCNKDMLGYKQPTYNLRRIFNDGYHTTRQGFKFVICKDHNENSLPIGMELETEFKIADVNLTDADVRTAAEQGFTSFEEIQRNMLLMELWQLLGRKDIIFERDGSLNQHGVECITNPMSLEYARKYWAPAVDFLENKTLGIYSGIPGHTKAGARNAWGIHLTFARKYWSDIALGKFVNFIYNDKNKPLTLAVAQRDQNYSGEAVGTKVKNRDRQFDFALHLKEPGEKIIGGTRSTSVNLTKRGFVEVRMFQAVNTKLEILKNYEYITALYYWLHNESTGFLPLAEGFLQWLYQPGKVERHKKYRHLITYLKQDKFRYRSIYLNTIKEIKNPYLNLTESLLLPKNIKV